ncbi:MAG TPA: DUF2382 domain-containing protein [Longimicrobiaceae bacterium]|nr:DUF2382 domain-containing protein [Longimicrobiaceae bacterium]
MAELNDRIVPLDELDDFEVADGDPDVRGWNVVASDGRKIGEVDQLLVDTAALKVRYLDVDLDDDLQVESTEAADADRHILIPIGYARLDEDEDQIFVDELSVDQIRAMPAYSHEPLTRDYETSLRQSLDRDFTAAPSQTHEDFYNHDVYDENRFYGARQDEDRSRGENERRVTLSEEELALGKREVRAGEVDVDKEVETHHVSRSVPVEHEEVIVEHRPPTAGMSASPRIEGEEVHIPVTEEEVVAEKRVVPKEELVVRKQEVQGNQTVEADLREETAEVHREGDVHLRDDRRGELRDER